MIQVRKAPTLLIVGFGTILTLMIILVAIGFRHMEAMQVSRERLTETYEKTRLAFLMREAIRKRSISLVLTPTLREFFDRDDQQQRFNGYAREFILAREQLLAKGAGEEETILLEAFQEKVRANRPLVEAAMQAAVDGVGEAELQALMAKAIAAQAGVLESIDGFVVKQAELGRERAKHISQDSREALRLLIIFGALVFAVGVGISVVVIRRERWHLQTLEARVKGRTQDLTQEIAEKKRAEEALRTSESRFRDFASATSDWYWEMDENLCYTYISEKYSEISGVRRETLIGIPRDEIPIPDLDEEAWQDLLTNLKERRAFRNFVHPRTHPDGHRVYLSINGKPFYDRNGEFKGFRGTGSDVTEMKKSETELRAAKEKAESASRTKSAFLANMSHELRTPLNAVIGFSETMTEQVFGPLHNEKYSEYAEYIRESGQHLLALINDILDLSKIEARKLVLYEEEMDFLEETEASMLLVRPQAENARVNLELNVPENLPRLYVDKRAIRQMLLNLLSNAIKFTLEGGSVSVAAYVADNGFFHITVTDTGIGMSEEDIDKAMSSFGQADSSIAHERKGTGLGLPLARGLASAHGGTLEIISQPGVGTTMTIRLPPERLLEKQTFPQPVAAESA